MDQSNQINHEIVRTLIRQIILIALIRYVKVIISKSGA